MVNAQELLKTEKEKEVINLTELLYNKDKGEFEYNEEGELRIESFKNLKEIKIDTVGGEYKEYKKVTKITIANCPKLEKADINTFVDNKELEITNCPNLTYLDCSYNKLEKLDLNGLINDEKENKLEILDCNSNKELTNLNINNCSQLKTFNCNNSKLTNLDASKCSKLINIYCQDNKLNSINLSKEKNSFLKILDLSKNKLSDFSFLNGLSLTNLKTFYLDKNEFNISLTDLKTKTPNLKELGVVESGIDLNLKELPSDLEKIYCDNDELQKKLELCKKLDNEGEAYYDYQTWKKLVNAQQWLDEHYPKDGEVIYNRKKGRDKKGKGKTTKLIISNKWLKDDLKLEQFTDLKKLDCSNNYLTSLDLTDCQNLTCLVLSNNQFNNVDFLNTLPNKEKLKVLKMSNNEKIPAQTLEFLKEFTELEELNIEDCPFEGSLSSLRNMKNLKKVYISHTDIEEGLEDLPKSCKELYCDLRYQSKHKTIKIAKELGKHLEEGEIRHYNLDKWRKEKRDGVALVIPLDKLPDSKNSIKKFLDDWDDNKVKGLKDPEQLKKSGERFSMAETSLKIPSFGGGILSLADYSRIGGALSVVAPVAEFIVEKLREKKYEEDKEAWDKFVKSSENIWDTYWELKETFQYIRPSSSMGEVSLALKELKEKINNFLKIDLEQLIEQTEKRIEDDQVKYEELEKLIKQINEHREEKLYEDKKERISYLRNKLAQKYPEQYKKTAIDEIGEELKESNLKEEELTSELSKKIKKIKDREINDFLGLNNDREEIIAEIKKEKTKKEEFEKELDAIFQDAKKAKTEEENKKIIERMVQLKDKNISLSVDDSTNSSVAIGWISISPHWNDWWNKPKNDNSKKEKSITKNNFPQYLQNNWDYKKPGLEEIEKAIENLQKEVSDYRYVFFGEEDIKNQQQESIKAIKDKLGKLLEVLEDIEKVSDEDHKAKLKEIISGIGKEKISEELEKLQKELEILVTNKSINNTQQLDNQSGRSNGSQQQTTNDKGKSKETNEYENQQLQEVKVHKNYGSTGYSK